MKRHPARGHRGGGTVDSTEGVSCDRRFVLQGCALSFSHTAIGREWKQRRRIGIEAEQGRHSAGSISLQKLLNVGADGVAEGFQLGAIAANLHLLFWRQSRVVEAQTKPQIL
jgi:hypothetical protein